ncbi:MAG: hypothetical protein ABSG05_02565 [Candidatus Pacearchaeota archaeon]|jgi:cytochrome c biogenesis protein CcdA
MASYPGTYPKKSGSGFLVVIYLLFGIYFINYAIQFVIIPTVVTQFDKWIILVGGVLLIIGAINQLRLNRYTRGY